MSDPELDKLPKGYYEDAVYIKRDIERRLQRANSYRKVRNIVGTAALVITTGLGIAIATDEIPENPGVAVGAVDSLALVAAGIANVTNRRETKMAISHAKDLGCLFTALNFDRPAWTEDPRALQTPYTPPQ